MSNDSVVEKDIYDTDQIIENAIEWLTSLFNNDYEKAVDEMQCGESRCCLGVAREILGPMVDGCFDYGASSIIKLADDPGDLMPVESKALGLREGGWNDLRLETTHPAMLNDGSGYGMTEAWPHTKIAAHLVTHADFYFRNPEVAEGIQRHFFLNEEVA